MTLVLPLGPQRAIKSACKFGMRILGVWTGEPRKRGKNSRKGQHHHLAETWIDRRRFSGLSGNSQGLLHEL
jgi:hypothetical protein